MVLEKMYLEYIHKNNNINCVCFDSYFFYNLNKYVIEFSCFDSYFFHNLNKYVIEFSKFTRGRKIIFKVFNSLKNPSGVKVQCFASKICKDTRKKILRKFFCNTIGYYKIHREIDHCSTPSLFLRQKEWFYFYFGWSKGPSNDAFWLPTDDSKLFNSALRSVPSSVLDAFPMNWFKFVCSPQVKEAIRSGLSGVTNCTKDFPPLNALIAARNAPITE